MRLPADLLGRTAEEGSRLLALFYLDQGCAAERRLADPQDREALHDFRVALRRLRSCTRAYRVHLGDSVPKRIRRRLRELASATNPIRDAEVQLTWLHQQSQRLETGEIEGLAWLVGRLEGRKYEALDRRMGEVGQAFSGIAARLRRRLGSFRVEVRTGRLRARPILAQVSGGLLREHAADLAASLVAIRGLDDTDPAHTARIRAKRLRYLLEPLSSRVPGVRGAVRRLKELQDVLGYLHDMQVLGEEVGDSLEVFSRRSGERPAGALPGLLAIQRTTREEIQTSFSELKAQWLSERTGRFFARLDEVGARLERSSSTPRDLSGGGATASGEDAEKNLSAPTLTIRLERAGQGSDGHPAQSVADRKQ